MQWINEGTVFFSTTVLTSFFFRNSCYVLDQTVKSAFRHKSGLDTVKAALQEAFQVKMYSNVKLFVKWKQKCIYIRNKIWIKQGVKYVKSEKRNATTNWFFKNSWC